ncbi:MAG: hypothetical protein AB8G05_24095 [Oligoflexales bacterium]
MIIIIILILLTSCATPMPESEIISLTTCRNTNIKKIRKNLLLEDFEIKSMAKDDLQTAYKQIGGYRLNKRYQRITVVRTSGKNFRFSVRYKTKSYDKVKTGGTEIRSGSSSIKTNQSQLVENDSERNERYYVDFRDRYRQLQRQVCGR